MNDLKVPEYEFINQSVQNAYSWFIENVISKIWGEEEWSKLAKGGEWEDDFKRKWATKYDLPYLGHILSGSLCALKMIDIFIHSKDLNSDLYSAIIREAEGFPLSNEVSLANSVQSNHLELKLKRSLMGYLFHDYVKITGSGYKMVDSEPVLCDLAKKYFNSMLDDIKLSCEELYQIAYGTEEGTKLNVFRDEVKIIPGLLFEISFSALADKISSKFSEGIEEDLDKWSERLTFCGVRILQRYKLWKINFTSTYFIATLDLLRWTIKSRLENSGGFFLWMTPSGLYYLSENSISLDLDVLAKDLENKIYGSIDLASGIEFTDRRINLPGRTMFHLTKDILAKVSRDPEKIKEALRPENKEIEDADIPVLVYYREILEKYFEGDLIVNLTKRPDKQLNYRELLVVPEAISDPDKTYRVILLRCVQLISSKARTVEIRKVRDIISHILKDPNYQFKGVIDALLRKTKPVNRSKNPLLAPLLVALEENLHPEERIDWGQLETEVLKTLEEMDSESSLRDNLKQLITAILDPLEATMPKVPDKREMSMIDGYPGREEAIEENLYGLRTNAVFTNRTVTSTVSNSLVDKRYLIESLLRKRMGVASEIDGDVFVYLDFPGPLPFLDLYRIFDVLYENREAFSGWSKQLQRIYISLKERRQMIPQLKTDISYFIPRKQPESSSEAFFLYQEAMDLAISTNLRVQVIDSHSPPILRQKEIFQYLVNSFVLEDFQITKVRYNRLREVQDFLMTIGTIASFTRKNRNKGDEVAEILREFSRNPLSLFSYALELADYNGGDRGKRIKPLRSRIEKYAGQGFGGVKGGVNTESLKKLARIGRSLWMPTPDMSGSQRSWMLRDSIDILEKALSEPRGRETGIDSYSELIEGHLYKLLRSHWDRQEEKGKINLDPERIREFSRTFLDLIKGDFGGKPPSGNMKAYVIDAFEFEYVFGD